MLGCNTNALQHCGKAIKKIDKDLFLSISLILSIINICPDAGLSRRRSVVAIPGKGVRCQWGQFGMRASPYAPPNIDRLSIRILIYRSLSIFENQPIFPKKSNIFGENGGRNFGGNMTIFQEKRSSYAKNEYNLFYRKLDAKSFYIKQSFRKKQYLSKK